MYSGELTAQGGHYNLTADVNNNQTVGRPAAAVHVSWTDRTQFDGNVFTRADATGLDLDHGVHNSAIVGNIVHDISGNG